MGIVKDVICLFLLCYGSAPTTGTNGIPWRMKWRHLEVLERKCGIDSPRHRMLSRGPKFRRLRIPSFNTTYWLLKLWQVSKLSEPRFPHL